MVDNATSVATNETAVALLNTIELLSVVGIVLVGGFMFLVLKTLLGDDLI